jgi:hypothetical protein
MSKQKVLGVVASGIMHLWEHHASGLQFVVISLLTPQRRQTLGSRPQYIVCLGQKALPIETDTDRTFFYRDKCNLCHLHGSCEATNRTFFYSKKTICVKKSSIQESVRRASEA